MTADCSVLFRPLRRIRGSSLRSCTFPDIPTSNVRNAREIATRSVSEGVPPRTVLKGPLADASGYDARQNLRSGSDVRQVCNFRTHGGRVNSIFQTRS
jgi:hypothetical protein